MAINLNLSDRDIGHLRGRPLPVKLDREISGLQRNAEAPSLITWLACYTVSPSGRFRGILVAAEGKSPCSMRIQVILNDFQKLDGGICDRLRFCYSTLRPERLSVRIGGRLVKAGSDACMLGSGKSPAQKERDRLLADLTARYREPFRRYFYRRVLNHAEAEDLNQELFVRIVRNAEGRYRQSSGASRKQHALKRWRDRADVAPWARDIDLVVTLHGMHWSGYIFNDYARMLQAVNWLTDRVPGKRVMFFLAGWEGRYYRTYGASAADERMGGADGLHKLVQGIHARGARVMAMYAGNASDERLAEFAAYGPQSGFKSLPGAMDWTDMRGYQVDRNVMRAGITGMGWLNPGAPAWRDHLIKQVGDLNATYGFDGSFFDTQPNVNNDYLHDPLQGLTEIADGLRDRKPDLLLATKTWYDLSLGVIPMSQTPDGPYNWSDRYQQRFAHVSLGEPSRGSTGVHELGRVPYNLADLLRSFSLPTLGIVEDALEKAPKAVQAVLAAARRRS